MNCIKILEAQLYLCVAKRRFMPFRKTHKHKIDHYDQKKNSCPIIIPVGFTAGL